MNDYDNYLEVIDEIKKIDIIKTPRYRINIECAVRVY